MKEIIKRTCGIICFWFKRKKKLPHEIFPQILEWKIGDCLEVPYDLLPDVVALELSYDYYRSLFCYAGVTSSGFIWVKGHPVSSTTGFPAKTGITFMLSIRLLSVNDKSFFNRAYNSTLLKNIEKNKAKLLRDEHLEETALVNKLYEASFANNVYNDTLQIYQGLKAKERKL
ncbi:MAG: hypothetical protein NT007_09785 [Candidatus Kapabacteria bacterium]|nr:hypothetical protein [Candidatus Kapabacteria bacterium]